MSRIYKILPREAWRDAMTKGWFDGAGPDIADGFIHFSTAEQLPETARRYFSGQPDLLVLEVEGDDLGDALRWEPSRAGAHFPHLYGSLACDLVRAATDAPLDGDGLPSLPSLSA